jgi:5-hydroxyisourate hydrolase
LRDGDALTAGAYRLELEIGAYFRTTGVASADPGFLETVVIDFHVTDASAHYHVPLLASPFGYSTYRGS